METSFKSHVVNDLFLSLHSSKPCEGDDENLEISLGSLAPVSFAYTAHPLGLSSLSTEEFNDAKEELKILYEDNARSWLVRQCVGHFLSNIQEPIKENNENLLKTLETLSLDDLESFAHQITDDLKVHVIEIEWPQDNEESSF